MTANGSGELHRWLASNLLAAYSERFESESISFDVFPDLTDADLQSLGLTLGDRKRFARAVASLVEPDAVSAEPRTGTRAGPGIAKPTAHSGDVQRRNITVLFCDLVDSTILANTMDREDFADLVRAYSRIGRAAITRGGGTVAKYTGDGLMAYFGYPVTHGDDAGRAIRAGLEIQAGVAELDDLHPVDVRARIGIASGIALVGNVLGDDAEPIVDAIGNTPALASRVESAAGVGTVTVADLTRRLAGDAFDYEVAGRMVLKGFDGEQTLHRVVGVRVAAVSFDEVDDRDVPLLGRESEMTVLEDVLRHAGSGQARAVCLLGDPGVGKSRVVRAFGARAASLGWTAFRFACVDQEHTVQAHPVRRAVSAAAGLTLRDDASLRRKKLKALAEGLASADDIDVLDALFDVSSSGDVTPTDRRARLFDFAARIVTNAARAQPLVVVVEDIHWADSTSLALIDHVLQQAAKLPFLLLLTARGTSLDHRLLRQSVTSLNLSALDDTSSGELVRAIVGSHVESNVVAAIVKRADGVPLFLEEIARSLLADGSISRVKDDDAAGVIPPTLHDTLTARLDLLPNGGELAPIAAALGRSFSADLLVAIAGNLDVETGLAELIDARLIDQNSVGTVTFRHSLIRDAAYDRMIRAERRAVHERAAVAIVEKFPTTAAASPHLVARHFEQTAQPLRAVEWWLRSAQLAASHSANAEVVSNADMAIANLDRERDSGETNETMLRLELSVQLLRAGALRGVAGFAAPITGAAYRRAKELCALTGDSDELFTALNGVYSYHLVHDEYDLAGEAAAEILERAKASGEKRYEMIGNRAVGAVAVHVGRLTEAETHLSRAIELYREGDYRTDRFVFGTDHASTSSVFLGLTQWVSGKPTQAVETVEWAIGHAASLDHMHSWAQAMTVRCFLAVLAKDWPTAVDRASLLIRRAEDHGLAMMAVTGRFWLATGSFFLGEAGEIGAMREMSDAWWNTGARSYMSFRNTLLAEAHADIGETAEGLRLVEAALERVEITNERWTESETHRVRGRIFAMVGSVDLANESFEKAIRIADNQQARLWALRAEISRFELIGATGDPTAQARIAERAGTIVGDATSVDLRAALLIARGETVDDRSTQNAVLNRSAPTK